LKKFKITLATVASALCGLTGVANAEYVGAVTKITDHYKTVIERDAYDVEVCYNEQVSGDKTGDTLKGAIIGGIIGNNVGNVENGGALGAVIGGMLGHNNSNATGGTKRVCRIETRYNETPKEIYSHSIVSFMYEGRNYTIRFQK
tara:strand:+ start:24 stop:458 length:435 start_codon:yes stop_codon:yes gene_type:complete